MTFHEVGASLREWTRRVWGALSGRRTDHDLQRELAGHLALAEDELRRNGHAPRDAALLGAFGIGLVKDMTTLSPLGLYAIAYSLVGMFTISTQESPYRRRMLSANRPSSSSTAERTSAWRGSSML